MGRGGKYLQFDKGRKESNTGQDVLVMGSLGLLIVSSFELYCVSRNQRNYNEISPVLMFLIWDSDLFLP